MSIKRRQRGLTLVELILFIVIVGVAVVGILQLLALNTRSSADPARRKQAMAIAEGLMEEVRQAAFTWCDFSDPAVETALNAANCTVRAEGPGREDAAATRPYDNVNDYGSANGAPVAYTTDVVGNAFPAGYQATVTVAQDGTLGPAGARLPADAVLRITVAVAYGSDNVTLESYRTRYAPGNVPVSPPSQPPPP